MLGKGENTVNCHLFNHVLLKCTFNQAEPKKSTKLKCYMKILICSAKILRIIVSYWRYMAFGLNINWKTSIFGVWYTNVCIMISLDRSFTFGQTSATDNDLYMSGLSICFEELLLVFPIVQASPRPNYAGTVGQHCPHSHCMQVPLTGELSCCYYSYETV